jgi:hypothetical protein
MIGHEEIQEKIFGNLQIVCLAKNIKGIDEPPKIWMELGGRNFPNGSPLFPLY